MLAPIGYARAIAAHLRGGASYADRCRALVAEHAPGSTFGDVGCMWKVDGAYAFHAAAHGATRVVGLDLMPPTAGFLERNRAAGDRVEFVQGDLNAADTVARVGPLDVVFCSGVLYHVPNPVFTLQQLRMLCRRTLILGSATVASPRPSQAAFFLPGMTAADRRRLGFATADTKIGLDTEYAETESYANWFWLFTPSCVEAMLRVAGFTVVRAYRWRHASCVLATAR